MFTPLPIKFDSERGRSCCCLYSHLLCFNNCKIPNAQIEIYIEIVLKDENSVHFYTKRGADVAVIRIESEKAFGRNRIHFLDNSCRGVSLKINLNCNLFEFELSQK